MQPTVETSLVNVYNNIVGEMEEEKRLKSRKLFFVHNILKSVSKYNC